MQKILLIDDEKLVRDNLSVYLEDEGFEVLDTHSGESGLSKLSTFKPDIVIVDLRLEGINGERFIKTAHAIDAKIKFIIHTGSKEYSIPDSLRAIGLNDQQLLYKPVVDLQQLLTAIRAI